MLCILCSAFALRKQRTCSQPSANHSLDKQHCVEAHSADVQRTVQNRFSCERCVFAPLAPAECSEEPPRILRLGIRKFNASGDAAGPARPRRALRSPIGRPRLRYVPFTPVHVWHCRSYRLTATTERARVWVDMVVAGSQRVGLSLGFAGLRYIVLEVGRRVGWNRPQARNRCDQGVPHRPTTLSVKRQVKAPDAGMFVWFFGLWADLVFEPLELRTCCRFRATCFPTSALF